MHCIILSHCVIACIILYYCIVPSHCIIALYHLASLYHCIVSFCIIVLFRFIVSLYHKHWRHSMPNNGIHRQASLRLAGWYLVLKHIFSGMCTWPETDVLYLRLPAIRPFAHQKLSEVAWSDTCSGLATHLWSQVFNSQWFPTQQLPGGKPSRRRWFSFFFFFFHQTAQQNEVTGWGNRKPMSHPGSSLSVWGAFCSVCCRTWDRSSTFLFTKLTKGRGKTIQSKCLVVLADCYWLLLPPSQPNPQVPSPGCLCLYI